MGEAPLARSDDLIIEELGDEVLIYDTTIDRGHSLSPEAARVWRACNGKTPVEELSSRLGLDQVTVDRALAELDSCELLEVKPSIVADGSTRREVTVKLAKVGAAAAAAPLILSAAAPTPAMASSLITCLNIGLVTSGSCGAGNPQDPDAGCKAQGCCCCPDCVVNSGDNSPFSCISGQRKCCVDDCANCNNPIVAETLGFLCTDDGCNCGNPG